MSRKTLFPFNGFGEKQGSPGSVFLKFPNPCHCRRLSTPPPRRSSRKHPRRQSSLLKSFSSTPVSFTNDGLTVADPSSPHSPFFSTLSPLCIRPSPTWGIAGQTTRLLNRRDESVQGSPEAGVLCRLRLVCIACVQPVDCRLQRETRTP
jgi:hypothetical protein